MKHFWNKVDSENWFNYQSLYTRMVNNASDGAVFVEVGTWKGMSAAFMAVEIINSGKKISFNCVDTWDFTPTQSDIPKDKYNNLYNTFLKNIHPVKQIIKPIRCLSWEAANNFKDNSIDFVFIDAGHDYDSVTKDLNAWWPKVKIGGVIAGHDYTNKKVMVKKAVNDFFKTNNAESKTKTCWEVTK